MSLEITLFKKKIPPASFMWTVIQYDYNCATLNSGYMSIVIKKECVVVFKLNKKLGNLNSYLMETNNVKSKIAKLL